METEKQKGKRPASGNKNLTQYSTPTKRSRVGPQSHPAEGHKKDSKNRKITRASTHSQEPIQDKLFTVITNKVIAMMKIKGARALDELTGPNKGKIRLPSRADEKREKVQQRKAQWIKTTRHRAGRVLSLYTKWH